jgi:signal transduction histidine kinase
LPHEHLGLFDTPPNRRQVRLSLAIAGVLFLASVPVLLVRDVRLPEIGSYFPTVDAIMFIGQLITATLLFAKASVFRSRALAILGACYLSTGLVLIPHALSYPGAFSPEGLLGGGLDTTAWLTLLRQPVFAIAVIVYALTKPGDLKARSETERQVPRIPLYILAAFGLAAAITILTIGRFGLLPTLFLDHARVIRSHLIGYECGAVALWVVAIDALWRRGGSILDMWLQVALASWLLVSLLTMTLPARFTAGFYWLSIVSLFSHLIVMLALITESTRLYARLELSASARSREREARMMSIDALAAAISHEVGQPLAAARLHANAALASLSAREPNADRAKASIRTTIEACTLAIGIVKNLQETFADTPGERATFDLADLVNATVPQLERELASERIAVQLTLDKALPPVLANRVQLQRVLINLLTNAIEALGATEDRPRQLTIRTAPVRGHGVLLEVSDNGVGIPRKDMERIFAPFFTTKSTGSGLGLPLCRLIVEAHGGRLWASRGADQGATLHLELPGGSLHQDPATLDHPPPSLA